MDVLDNTLLDTPSPPHHREYTTCNGLIRIFLSATTNTNKRVKISSPVNTDQEQQAYMEEDITSHFSNLMKMERTTTLQFPAAVLVDAAEIILELNIWLLGIRTRYRLPDKTIFVAVQIMYKYICQQRTENALEHPFLLGGVCLIIADKLDNANQHIKPSRLIVSEESLLNYTVSNFIQNELKVLKILEWKLEHMHAPHTFVEYFFHSLDIHAKIQRTTKWLMKRCIMLRDFVFLSASEIGVYSLLAACLHHKHVLYYDQVCALHAPHDVNMPNTLSMCQSVLAIITDK